MDEYNPTYQQLESLSLVDFDGLMVGYEGWCKVGPSYVRLVKQDNYRNIFHNHRGPAVVRKDSVSYWINNVPISRIKFFRMNSRLGRALYGVED